MLPRSWASLRPGALLRALLAARGSIAVPLGRGWDGELQAIRETRRRVPLLMSDARALQLMICVRAARSLDGIMAEAGVLMGGSARLICESKGSTPLHLFDVFETLQQSGAAGASSLRHQVSSHFGGVHGKLASVERLLSSYRDVHLHPGVFPDSVPHELDEARFSFVHIDMDLPDCIAAGFDFFFPRLVPGGILIVDDHEDSAVRETCATFLDSAVAAAPIELPWGQLMIVKKG